MNNTCIWSEDEDGIWHSFCGQSYVFIERWTKRQWSQILLLLWITSKGGFG